jgi:hypothetical protein
MKRKKGESQYSYNLAKNSEKEYKKVLNKAMKNYIKKIHSFNSFFRKMIFTNFKTSSTRKINSQIIEIFNYLNISPIIIKNKIFLVVVL